MANLKSLRTTNNAQHEVFLKSNYSVSSACAESCWAPQADGRSCADYNSAGNNRRGGEKFFRPIFHHVNFPNSTRVLFTFFSSAFLRSLSRLIWRLHAAQFCWWDCFRPSTDVRQCWNFSFSRCAVFEGAEFSLQGTTIHKLGQVFLIEIGNESLWFRIFSEGWKVGEKEEVDWISPWVRICERQEILWSN